MKVLISDSTVEVIKAVELTLAHNLTDFPLEFHFRREIKTTSSLQSVRERLIALNHFIAKYELLRQYETPLEIGENFDWLLYEQEIEIVPIYQEAVALVERIQIVLPSQIQSLLSFIRIPKSRRTAVDSENDGHGYHFHYGEIKKSALVRYDVLLTFSKANTNDKGEASTDTPLYVEPHGVGKYVHIDASTIGHNRRLPIYLVCNTVMRKRGIKNFMRPSNDSWQFYPLA